MIVQKADLLTNISVGHSGQLRSVASKLAMQISPCSFVELDDKERLSKVVKLARGDRSQRQFSKLLGVSPTTVQLWERGETFPDVSNLAQIAAYAGYTLEELMSHLKGQTLHKPSDTERVIRQIQGMPIADVALINQVTATLLAEHLGGSSPPHALADEQAADYKN